MGRGNPRARYVTLLPSWLNKIARRGCGIGGRGATEIASHAGPERLLQSPILDTFVVRVLRYHRKRGGADIIDDPGGERHPKQVDR